MIAIRDRCDDVIFASPFTAATSHRKLRLDHVRDHGDGLEAIPALHGDAAPSLTMTVRANYTAVVLS
jgi:hypothetical protein